MMALEKVEKFTTSEGRVVYGLPIEAFPNFIANVYVVSDGETRLLVDCGSPMPSCSEQLVARFAEIGERYGEDIALGDLDKILITHGHMDHFGGLPFVRRHTDAPIGIHVLDRRVVSHWEERLVVAGKQLQVYLERCGLSENARTGLMQMYVGRKGFYESQEVDFLISEDEEPSPGITATHVPGHCPGQVALQVDDILLSADHVLSRITPHQSPESITLNMGLGHYLDALDKSAKIEGVRLALGGHEDPMKDLSGRVQEIKDSHDERLNHVLDYCRESPCSIADVSKQLFGGVGGYTVLLALEEAGAHVEYLYNRGELVAANVDELRDQEEPVIRYLAE
ncbi:MAG: MBL fold metallo-hydrolase [Acidobacteriota bacterium]|nr:MBL fold metallo-hydrolase [Acidobacteriota bacterium]